MMSTDIAHLDIHDVHEEIAVSTICSQVIANRKRRLVVESRFNKVQISQQRV